MLNDIVYVKVAIALNRGNNEEEIIKELKAIGKQVDTLKTKKQKDIHDVNKYLYIMSNLKDLKEMIRKGL